LRYPGRWCERASAIRPELKARGPVSVRGRSLGEALAHHRGLPERQVIERTKRGPIRLDLLFAQCDLVGVHVEPLDELAQRTGRKPVGLGTLVGVADVARDFARLFFQ